MLLKGQLVKPNLEITFESNGDEFNDILLRKEVPEEWGTVFIQGGVPEVGGNQERTKEIRKCHISILVTYFNPTEAEVLWFYFEFSFYKNRVILKIRF